MGDVRVEILLENYHDALLARRGYLAADAVRRERVRVLADSGCTMLVLPQDLVERLGLELSGEKVIVTYADERREERPVAGLVTVRVGNRSMQTDCVVGPPLSEPLLGQIVLERLDLLVDCREGKLVPRPESPYLPSLKMKGATGHPGADRCGRSAGCPATASPGRVRGGQPSFPLPAVAEGRVQAGTILPGANGKRMRLVT